MTPYFYIRLCGFFCLILFFFSTFAFAGSSPGRANVAIGFSGPLSGYLSVYGEEMLNGCLLAVEEINSRTTVNISLLVRDSKGDPEIASRIASDFSQNKDVIAVIGGFKSDCNMVAAPIYDKAGILMISPTESHSGFTAVGSNIFRASATQVNEAEFNAQWAKDMGFHSFISIYLDDLWGNNANNLFVISSREKDIISKAEFPITPDFDRYDDIVDYIQNQKPDFIYSILFYQQAYKLFKALKSHGLTIPILTASSLLSDDITANCYSCSAGIMGPSSFSLEEIERKPLVQSFRTKYLDTFNKSPSLYAALAYDSMHLVYIAITNSAPVRNELKKGMMLMYNYQGVTGLFSFKKGRSPGKKLYRMTFKNHQWVSWHPELKSNLSVP